MSDKQANAIDAGDPFLKELATAIDEVTSTIEVSEDHAVLILGVKYFDEEKNPDAAGVETFISAAGYFGIIAEGLYAELREQIESGNTSLFQILREVVRDIEEDMNLDPEEEFGDDGEPSTLH